MKEESTPERMGGLARQGKKGTEGWQKVSKSDKDRRLGIISRPERRGGCISRKKVAVPIAKGVDEKKKKKKGKLHGKSIF